MFYSHEILTSQAYGVATVWLVSTIGLRSTTKKISRKAIQEVNVQKACETILQTGAPIALRLQGSLLYGLSRVYSQQCHYVLTDAEKVQAHMRAFYNALGGSDNALDPQAGKAKRKDLILEDDPDFDLNPDLPVFHLDDDGNFVPDLSVSSSNRSIIAGFDLSQSPFGGRNSAIRETFRVGTMTPSKQGRDLLQLGDEERELQAVDDWGIEIDADGNIVMDMEEPQLPGLSQSEDHDFVNPVEGEPLLHFDADGDVFMSGALPVFHSDPPVPFGQEHQIQHPPEYEEEQQENPAEQEVMGEPEVSAGQAPARAQRKRRRAILAPDNQTKVSRQELKSWSTNYLANTERATRPRHGTTLAEARKNAFNLVFGSGIAGVGLPTGLQGLPHPLAPDFAGEGLQARLLGIIITPPAQASRGRRRTALEALELEQDDVERRVRRRVSEDNEDHQDAQPTLPLHDNGDEALRFADDDADLPPVEVGRRAGSVLPDIPSDVPWNRPSSQIPSSSIKAGGSKPPSHHVSASPLHGRGSLAIPGPEIERFSDNQPFLGSDNFLGSEGFAPLPHSGGGGSSSKDSSPLSGVDTQSTSQLMRAALDREGRNFLDYVQSVAEEKGYDHHPDPTYRTNQPGNTTTTTMRWVDFDTLFGAEDQKRAIVAQAFYHVLSLATKNVIRVAQDGQGTIQPFGTIRLGVEAVSAI
ncbi:hypothetical protein VTJ49DRAFT_7687 [Mycothermus thermophilus]|uniref:Rad21/Rec8-like protein N-terminal domain-containing protein n=1 Tax=Humicola insolens TaxID=85995 RepID=A0ABR3VGC7_HUMIN